MPGMPRMSRCVWLATLAVPHQNAEPCLAPRCRRVQPVPLNGRARGRRGIQYTLVDSIATERIPHCCSQSASACRSRVKVRKLRTGWGSRSAPIATNNSLAATSMRAASGCKLGNSSHRFLALFAISSSETGRMPKGRIHNKLPIEIVVRADERHHTSVRKPRTHASPSGLNIEHQCRRGL